MRCEESISDHGSLKKTSEVYDKCMASLRAHGEKFGNLSNVNRTSESYLKKNGSAKECGNCAFFETIDSKRGSCKRYSPRPTLTTIEAGPLFVEWPEVKNREFCGEFESKK